MSKSRGGLGRGLASLIPTGPSTSTINDVIIGGSSPEPAPAAPAAPAAAETATEAPAPPARRTPAAKAAVARQRAAQAARAESEDTVGPRYEELPIQRIRPNPKNPRTVFDEDALAELEHSIREFGLLQPIVVRAVADGFELIMGERRWRAAQRVGLTEIPAIVRRTEDADLLRDALLENIHRANLNPLEEAAAYQQLLQEFDVTHEELASRLGRSRPVISNTIRLLKLPVPVQRRVAAGVLSAGHARALLSLEDPQAQEDLATRIVAEGLSVRGTEEAVTLMAGAKKTQRKQPRKKVSVPGLDKLAVSLSDTFDTRVTVEMGQRKGRVVVEFATVEDLERIIAVMAPGTPKLPESG